MNTIVFGNEIFLFTQKIRELAIEVNPDIVSGYTFASEASNGLDLIRFEGVLSHNNATGLLIAMGVACSYLIYGYTYKKKYLIIFFVSILALSLTAARTSILSLIVATIFFYFIKNFYSFSYNKYTLSNKIKSSKIFWLLFSILFLVWIFMYSPFNFLFTPERIASPIRAFIASPELVQFSDFLKNPLMILGIGYTVIGDFSTSFNTIRSDDLYFIQLISIYGLPGIILFIYSLFNISRFSAYYCKIKAEKSILIISFGLFLVSMPFVSIIHSGALGRPQIYPLIFIGLAAISFCIDEAKRLKK